MISSFKALLSACLALLLIGCDRDGRPLQEPGLAKLARGVSTEGDVRTVMGKPDTVWGEGDGRRALQYPKGPEGTRTWEFLIDSHGILVDYRQLLTEENFANVKPGMTRDEVRRLLGRERTTVQFKRKNEEVMDWRYKSAFGDFFFNVHFDMSTGTVTATSSTDANNY